jgi:hypothetical protein
VRFEDDFSTIVSITNVGNQQTRYTAYLTFPEGGQYSLGGDFLESGQTALFDLQKIRSEGRPDSNKNLFPTNLTTAQLHWSMVGSLKASRLNRARGNNQRQKTGEQQLQLLGMLPRFRTLSLAGPNCVHPLSSVVPER